LTTPAGSLTAAAAGVLAVVATTDSAQAVPVAAKDRPHNIMLATTACFKRLLFMVSRKKRMNRQHSPTPPTWVVAITKLF